MGLYVVETEIPPQKKLYGFQQVIDSEVPTEKIIGRDYSHWVSLYGLCFK